MKTAIFGISLILCLAVGLPCGAFLVTPLHRSADARWIAVAEVSDLNSDGAPALFPVKVSRRDAWMQRPDVIAGHVYLRRAPEGGDIFALNAETSPMRLPVTYDRREQVFREQCWRLTFDLDGNLRSRGRERLEAVDVKVVEEIIYVCDPQWSIPGSGTL